jgi:surface polysaccharide O-acyltransferase-like enzyme
MVRIESVDIFRLIAIIAIITIHSTAFNADVLQNNLTYKYLYIILDQLARFAVPFFFVIAGYFWGVKINSGGDLIATSCKMAKRISIIFFAWSFIYLLPLDLILIYQQGILTACKVAYLHAIELFQHPITLVMQGSKVHLWFLIAMLSALLLSTIFIYKKQTSTLLVLAIGLYLLGILTKAYAQTPLGIDMTFNTRNGPFFSTLLFVTGYLLSKKQRDYKWMLYGFIIFSFGCVLHFTEIFTLWLLFDIWPQHDFVFGTYFMGLGIALAALSNHPMLRSQTLSKIGQVSLGIYAVHYIFIDLLLPIDESTDAIFWELGFVMLVFALSLLTTLLLAKNTLTQKIVV